MKILIIVTLFMGCVIGIFLSGILFLCIRRVIYKLKKLKKKEIHCASFSEQYYEQLSEKQTKQLVIFSGIGYSVMDILNQVLFPIVSGLSLTFLYTMIAEKGYSMQSLDEFITLLFVGAGICRSYNIFITLIRIHDFKMHRLLSVPLMYICYKASNENSAKELLIICSAYIGLYSLATFSKKYFIKNIIDQRVYIPKDLFNRYWQLYETIQIETKRKFESIKSIKQEERWWFKYGLGFNLIKDVPINKAKNEVIK